MDKKTLEDLPQDRDFYFREYITNEKSMKQIAEMFGCSQNLISKALDKFGVKEDKKKFYREVSTGNICDRCGGRYKRNSVWNRLCDECRDEVQYIKIPNEIKFQRMLNKKEAIKVGEPQI